MPRGSLQELSNAVSGLAATLHDNELRDAVATFADKRLRELDAAPLLARVLDAVCDSGQHQKVLTTTLRGLMKFLDENRATFRKRLAEESPEWVPDWVDDRVFNKGFAALQSFLADVDAGLRTRTARRVRPAAARRSPSGCAPTPSRSRKVERAKGELLDHPQVREWLEHAVDARQEPGRRRRRRPGFGAAPRRRAAGGARRRGAARRSRRRPPGRAGAAAASPGTSSSHYGKDLTAVISSTIERWDTEETSRRLELQVGRDLQFIRINGTVVGSLAGLLIYTLTQLF